MIKIDNKIHYRDFCDRDGNDFDIPQITQSAGCYITTYNINEQIGETKKVSCERALYRFYICEQPKRSLNLYKKSLLKIFTKKLNEL